MWMHRLTLQQHLSFLTECFDIALSYDLGIYVHVCMLSVGLSL